jgi:hypothetical protein
MVSVPPLIVVPPLYVFTPVNVNVPVFDLLNDTPDPARTALMLTDAELLTVYPVAVKIPLPLIVPPVTLTTPTVSLLLLSASVPPLNVTLPLS